VVVVQLIQRKPMNRLGLNGPEEVKNHPWFRGFPWNKVLNKQFDPPFIPSVRILSGSFKVKPPP